MEHNKYAVIILLALLGLFGCGQKTNLTEQEINICKTLSFDQALAGQMKKATNGEIVLIPEISEYGEVLDATGDGLCSLTTEDVGYEFVARNKEMFRGKGYLLFVFEDDQSQKYLATIKGKDELDILKWRQTNGANYDLENKDVIERLAVWKAKNDFILLGVGMDWLQLRYTSTLPDFNTFADEIYEFCPDIVDQGTGDIPTMIREFKQIRGIYLWWD